MLKRLESLLRPWAIPNLTVILIAGQVLLYLVQMARAGGNLGVDALAKIYLDPRHGAAGRSLATVHFRVCPTHYQSDLGLLLLVSILSLWHDA